MHAYVFVACYAITPSQIGSGVQYPELNIVMLVRQYLTVCSPQ
jgi:hypothetical protein